MQVFRSRSLLQPAVSLEFSLKLERVNHEAGSHWWRGWPEGSEVFKPECTDARPGNHKTGENLSKPVSYDQKRYRKQLCQESFLLLAGTLSFWSSLSQLLEQMLSPTEPLLKYFLVCFELAPQVSRSELLSISLIIHTDFSEVISYWLFALFQLAFVWCSGPV